MKAMDAMHIEVHRQGFHVEGGEFGRDSHGNDTVKLRLTPIGIYSPGEYRSPPVDANAIARVMAEVSGKRTSITVEIVIYGDSEWGAE